MRIISQDGRIDVPYEQVSIEQRENEIWCGYSSTMQQHCIGKCFAKYSTIEKVKKAMDMLRETYNPSRIPDNVVNELNRLGIKVNPIDVVELANRDMSKKYFQFPQDSEIEVQQ